MARYCTNCGARLDGSPRFCGSCGKPCAAADNRTPIQNSGAVRRKSKPSGIWVFFAGTAIGAFLTHLFGRSSSASASNTTHTEPTEHYHDTSVHVDDAPDHGSYAGYAAKYEDGITDNDNREDGAYGSDDSDYGGDGYGDYDNDGYGDYDSNDYDDYDNDGYDDYGGNDYGSDYDDN